MAYPFTVTVNFDILCDCHESLSLVPGNIEASGLDPENAIQEIEIAPVKTESDYRDLKERLNEVLTKKSLQEHGDHFLYLLHIFYEIDAPDYILKKRQLNMLLPG
ncbi:MAG TPA: hypothetical protein VGB63_14670 [Pedobacter sp.]|jgi:hypothetical protein